MGPHLSKPAGITTWRETWKKIFSLFFRRARFLIGLKNVAWRINWLPKSSFAPTGKGYDVISVLGVALPDGCGQLPTPRAHFGGRGLWGVVLGPTPPPLTRPYRERVRVRGNLDRKRADFPAKILLFPNCPFSPTLPALLGRWLAGPQIQ